MPGVTLGASHCLGDVERVVRHPVLAPVSPCASCEEPYERRDTLLPVLPAAAKAPVRSAGRTRTALMACVGAAALLVAAVANYTPPARAEVTIDTFPSTSQIQPLVANPLQDPGLIGQAVVVPSGSPVLPQL